MAIAFPVFPIGAVGQFLVKPIYPLRGPGWSVKQTATWSNHKEQAVNGQVMVVKYWTNPLWKWEFKYDVIIDDPARPNGFYTVPIPATDFEILKSFYCAMQGQGNMFAYQPADAVRGGSFTAASVVVSVNGTATITTTGTPSLTQLRLGDVLHASGFATATYLNGGNGTVTAINLYTKTITLQIATGGTHALVTDSGTLVGGQPLTLPDLNGNTEVVNTVGSYPTTIAAIPTTNLVTESLQLIDTSTLTIRDGGASVGFTLFDPDTVAPYQGYVVTFNAGPTGPLTAQYTYYYLCRFSEDTQDYENFITLLWSCNSVKVDQVRI